LNLDLNRREFLKITAGAGATLAMPTLGHTASSSKMIGIQVGAISFVDEGTEKVLDILQERAGVNTLFLAVFTYGRGIAGRQIPGQPLPDHGRQEYDLNFHGGNFATPHPQYYRNTVIRETRAPDHGNLDILAEVLPAARRRGMKVLTTAISLPAWSRITPALMTSTESCGDPSGRARFPTALALPMTRRRLIRAT
jgi:TAT (twin-arginine translocation) pathway-exported protein